MITIDYLLRRDQGNKIIDFRPDERFSRLPLLSYIEAKNAYGKSTLMNIIALAFFGHNLTDEEINPKLKGNLLSLLNSEAQDLQFRLEIENDKLGVHYISEKKELESKQIVLRKVVDGKSIPISEDSFKKEFKLIYEIPNNPLDRLTDLLNTLRDQQKNYSSDITNLRNRVRELIEEIKDSRDPELINNLKVKLTEDNKKYDEIKRKETEHKNKLKDMQEYYYSRFISTYKKQEKDLNIRVEELKKQIKTEKRKQSKKYKNYQALSQKLSGKIDELQSLKENIDLVLQGLIDRELKIHYLFWKGIPISDEIYHPDVYSSKSESQFIARYLRNKLEDENVDRAQEITKLKLYRSLIAILTDYTDEIDIPGVSVSISELICGLQEQVNDLNAITLRLNNIGRCAQYLDRFCDSIDEGIMLAGQIRENRNFEEEEIENFSVLEEIENHENRSKKLNEKIKNLTRNANTDGFDVDEILSHSTSIESKTDFIMYSTFNEKQIEEKVEDLKNKLRETQSTVERLEKSIIDQKEELDRLEAKAPHIYQNRFTSLKDLLIHIQQLEVLFNSFDSWLTNIQRKTGLKNDGSEDEQKYRDMVGNFLAKKIGKLRHIDDIYTVSRVDVVSEKIFTEEGAIIPFRDLSGGQSRAAYLEGLLGMSENKKIIALFDEVAMMDESSLEPILEKLIQLYDEKKLLLAVIAQKRNSGVLVKDIYDPSGR